MIEINDQIIDAMARAMWDRDAEASLLPASVYAPAWERSKDLYRRRAEAAAEVLPGVRFA